MKIERLLSRETQSNVLSMVLWKLVCADMRKLGDTRYLLRWFGCFRAITEDL